MFSYICVFTFLIYVCVYYSSLAYTVIQELCYYRKKFRKKP